MRIKIFFFKLFFPIVLIAQQENDSIQKLDEIFINSKRIALVFKENSNTLELMDSIEIATYSKTSLDALLQNMVGIDIRRRGVEGTQSDLYIRGGNFEQVLLLIDGIKMDDLQSGHHTMNGIVNPENIERIEVIKGAASRIYGQNAMNGAVNIITKKVKNSEGFVKFNAGSFETYGASMGYAAKLDEEGSIQFSVNNLKSDGYRYNTDFDNWNGFFKAEFGKNEILGTYGQRAFGANGFYASPLFIDQYEETQTHLLALKRKLDFKNFISNVNIYWRRNQDYYLLKRNQPDFYKNKHNTQKIGAEWNANYKHQWLTSALGLDVNYGEIESTNLGKHERLTVSLFVEERIQSNSGIFDITPGASLHYYSDFGWFVYPGIDLGIKMNRDLKFYGNLGYTSRIPNFTNLYYNSSTEQGNSSLKPEKAITSEIGFYYTPKKLLLNVNYFHRYSDDLIDWAKDSLAAPKWQARNFSKVEMQGVEILGKYRFDINNYHQFVKIGYTYANEKFINDSYFITRYTLNSFKHQLVTSWFGQFGKRFSQNISYRFVEKALGETYNITDVNLKYHLKHWKISLNLNNIFDIAYSETNLVPMPGFNFGGSITFNF